ncbi:MAG: hypothetical protein Q4P29_07140 [Tissierellia bacterium]|nr:hypothetical protein [Tissierellia bacterium]
MTENNSKKLELTYKMRYAALLLLPFLILFIISKTLLKDLYLFEWTSRHLYLYIWVLVLAFVLTDNKILAKAIVYGNIAGIIIGQFLGDFIRNQNISKITSDMNAEQIYRMHKHPGFQIWIIVMIISIVISLIFKKRKK